MTRPLTLRQLTALALQRALGEEAAIQMGESLARALDAEMRVHGLALHFTRTCVPIPHSELGRPMTPEEMRAVGIEEDG